MAQSIDIEINPVYFVFSWKDHERKVATIVSLDAGTWELVGIGERIADQDVVSVGLFSSDEALPPGVARLDLLQTFLEFNIAKLLETERILVFKPTVIFHGDQQLKQILCGYQRSLLEIAARAAGAKEVSFK